MVALFFLLVAIIGFVAFLSFDLKRWIDIDGADSTEATMPSEQYEDFGINLDSLQETHSRNLIQEYKEHTMRFLENFDIE